MNNVVYLNQPPRRIAHFLRVGFREHILADRLRSEGKLGARRFVFEAGNVPRQRELIAELKAESGEIVLDTSVAEQSVIGCFGGIASNAPWAHRDRMLEQDDFRPRTNRSVIEPIAHFAVAEGFHTVLSPAHYLGKDQVYWRETDWASCEALRVALDREGGRRVAIDYPLILDGTQIKDAAFRRELIEPLASLPIDNIWLRVSGFGYDATGAGIEKMVRAVHSLHELGRPIIVDRSGGLAAYSLAAFGIASGFANGLKGKDNFDAASYLKPKGGGGGGNDRTVYVAGLDRRVKVTQLEELFSRSVTARTIFGCRQPSCCRSVDAMIREPEAHRALQQRRDLDDLSRTPEAHRASHFLDSYVEAARREAVRAQRLKAVPAGFHKLSDAAAVRLNRMADTLEETSRRFDGLNFAHEAKSRATASPTGKDNRGKA